MTLLSKMVTPDRVVWLDGMDKKAALDRLVDVTGAAPTVGDTDALRKAIFDREAVMSTGISLGIAVPHARVDSVKDITVSIGVSATGIDYGAIDDQPVHIIVMVAAGAHQHLDYLRTLARVVLVLKNPKVRKALMAAMDSESIYDIIRRY